MSGFECQVEVMAEIMLTSRLEDRTVHGNYPWNPDTNHPDWEYDIESFIVVPKCPYTQTAQCCKMREI